MVLEGDMTLEHEHHHSVRLFNQDNVQVHVVLATIWYEEVPRRTYSGSILSRAMTWTLGGNDAQ